MSKDDCRTRYPVFLIHGAGFRDLKRPVYWGRIPKVLKEHGALVCYGLHDAWGGVETNADKICSIIDDIIDETGAEKVNLIGHSKGGLEARRAASFLGYGRKIASVTTIATPHHGSKAMDKLMKLPRGLFSVAAFAVNNWIRLVGDRKPDFLQVCECFTTAYMESFNRHNPEVPGVRYRSYACVMFHPFSDINLSAANFIINRLEGPNDGLVSVESATWGETTVLRSPVFRGISHLDAVDLRRRPLRGKKGGEVFDICDVYVDIVRELKDLGM